MGDFFFFSGLARSVPDNYLLNEHKRPHPYMSGKWSMSTVSVPSVIHPSGEAVGRAPLRTVVRATSPFRTCAGRVGAVAMVVTCFAAFRSRSLTHARACRAVSG
jgi:hypothetical protein